MNKIYAYSLLLIMIMSCSKKDNSVELKQWVIDQKIMNEFYSNNTNDCNRIKEIYESLTTEEFKNKLYGNLADCAIENPKELKKYLLKDVSSGLHPERIDSIKYASVYQDIKDEIEISHKKFWKDRDTTFFLEIEKRSTLDQTLALEHRKTQDSAVGAKRLKVFEENTKYLLEYCENYGYPKVPEVSNFPSFRTGIRAAVIAFHADYESKVKLLKYSIEAAKKGDVTWYDPISICITFHTNEMKFKEPKPIFFLHYNDNTLDLKESYLQLYSIEKHYNQDMGKGIVLQPSKYNIESNHTIEKQLEELKNVLIDEFSFPRERIKTSYKADKNENDYRYVSNYQYTLSYL